MPVVIQNDNVRISGDGAKACNIRTFEFAMYLEQHLRGDPLTRYVEDIATQYVAGGFPQVETQFLVRIICAWGGLRRRNPEILYRENAADNFGRMTGALLAAYDRSIQGRYSQAMAPLRNVRGVGISFKSKFLKFLCPDHAAVLDSKIRKNLNYAHSAAGYAALVEDCAAIRTELNDRGLRRDGGAPWRTSDVEMAIFKKIR